MAQRIYATDHNGKPVHVEVSYYDEDEIYCEVFPSLQSNEAIGRFSLRDYGYDMNKLNILTHVSRCYF